MNKKNIFVVLPAFNEGERIQNVIKNVKKQGYQNIIVVDDGSTDLTGQIAKDSGAKVITHIINRGPGAATQTAFTYALSKGAEIVVTMDADGQHQAEDIQTLLEELDKSGMDVVIGSRFKNNKNKIPFLRTIFNMIASMITFMLSSIWLSDSQTGFKAMTSYALSKISITSSGFEFCTEIIMQIRHHSLKYKEVPISVEYSKESMGKGQNFAMGISTLFRLFLQALSRI